MKKYLTIAVLAMACACTKGTAGLDQDGVGGRSVYNDISARNYMMGIVDNLATDVLDQMEAALLVESQGNGVSSRFDISGGSILKKGVSWRVTAQESRLCGMTIQNTQTNGWELSYSGEYTILGESYPTSFTMSVSRKEQVRDHHYNWEVTLNGDRTEREGYACKFSTQGTVKYLLNLNNQTVSSTYMGWNQLTGKYSLQVLRDGKTVDVWQMVLNGAPSTAQFIRGL